MNTDQEKNEAARFESLAGGNECYFVGNHGLVFQGIYLQKSATVNTLISSSNEIFTSSDVSKKCIVSIEMSEGSEPRAVIRDRFTKSGESSGKWVVFTPEKIYFFDYDEHSFGFYSRPK